MTRVCIEPGCPNLQPCPIHQRSRSSYSPNRDNSAHVRWARQIKKRDRYTCQRCGAHGPGVKLDAHHTTPTTGITLCNSCHTIVDNHARLR
jgi:predicted RNA-binding Zn-ribbon protein involved in translation (DUF1610 family)